MNLLELEEYIKNLTNNGIIRRVDELGRIVIPYIFRENIFQECEVVYLQRIGEFIILTKNNEDQTAIRKILDELGRVVINIEIRKDLNWNEKDAICIWNYKDCIIMKKFEEKCVFCKTTKKLSSFREKLVCQKCKNELSRIE